MHIPALSNADTDPSGNRPYRGNGLQPGVDLDDSAALLDIMNAGQLG